MRRNVGRPLLATALAFAIVFPGTVLNPPAASAAAAADPPTPPDTCAAMTAPDENHASIRLRVDQPASGAEVSVDEQGKIAVGGILHKQATMVDVRDDEVTASDFTIGPPPDGVSAWASSWTTSLRPTQLGPNQICVRAERDPKRTARILRSFTVVDLIPPSAVPSLSVGDITATKATVTWGAATDNYGLAGYGVSVDGGPARRTTVGTLSYTITGLAPASTHTVSVVAIDLAGNTSAPATTSFTTDAAPPPPDPGLTIDPEQGGATAVWHPDVPTDVTYRAFLDGQLVDEFPVDLYCQDTAGHPVSGCTAEDVVSYPVEPLAEATQYAFRVEAVRADGTTSRSLDGSFTTMVSLATVPDAVTQMLASESSRCAATGGDYYVSPTARGAVPPPAGSTQVFDGCYRAGNSNCIDAFLPPSGNKLIDCADDITRLLFSVAPAGRGPVISSLDGVVDYLGTPATPARIQISPISWCTQGACALLLAPPMEVAKVLAKAAPVAAAETSLLLVSVAGIAIGVALFVLLEILFPTAVAIAGLLEYPIDFDTDFDTFDNWDLDKGEYYNSLKIYAEVIKTTKQLADKHDLPFAWNDAEDGDLRSTINLVCSIQRGQGGAYDGCGDDFAVYVPGGLNYQFRPMKETGTHIVTALGDGNFPQPPQRAQWFYPGHSVNGKAATTAGFSRGWFDTVPFRPNNDCVGRASGVVCDEFPFWTTDQAVTLSGVRASLQRVPGAESLPQASDLSGFFNQCDVPDGERFIVLPVKPWVAANGPSFGFQVSDGGASLCMPPRPPGP